MDLSLNRHKSTSWNIVLNNALCFCSDSHLRTLGEIVTPMKQTIPHSIVNKRMPFKNNIFGLFYLSMHMRIIWRGIGWGAGIISPKYFPPKSQNLGSNALKANIYTSPTSPRALWIGLYSEESLNIKKPQQNSLKANKSRMFTIRAILLSRMKPCQT